MHHLRKSELMDKMSGRGNFRVNDAQVSHAQCKSVLTMCDLMNYGKRWNGTEVLAASRFHDASFASVVFCLAEIFLPSHSACTLRLPFRHSCCGMHMFLVTAIRVVPHPNRARCVPGRLWHPSMCRFCACKRLSADRSRLSFGHECKVLELATPVAL